MSAAVRLLLVLSLALGAAGTAVTAAPADPREAPRATLPLVPGDVEWLGTWSGTITVEGLPDPFDGGYVAFERAPGNQLAVTVGPEAGVRYTGVRLERTERGIRFEISLPAFETRLLVYDVEVDHGRMTGTVTFVKHRLTKPGSLAFVRS